MKTARALPTLVLALWLAACGGTASTPDLPTAPEPTPGGTLTGLWTGTTTTFTGTLRTDFDLTQNGNLLTGAAYFFPSPGGELATTLEGVVTNKVITVVVELPLNGQDLTFVYQGTLDGTNFAGQVTARPADGTGSPEQGRFTLSRSAQP